MKRWLIGIGIGVGVGIMATALIPVPKGFETHRRLFQEKAAKYNLDWIGMAAIAWVESGFKQGARLHTRVEDSHGLMQIRKDKSGRRTIRNLGFEPNDVDLFDPAQHLEVAAALLRRNRNDGFSRSGIISDAAIWTAGPRGIRKDGSVAPFVNPYVFKVLGRYMALQTQVQLGLI